MAFAMIFFVLFLQLLLADPVPFKIDVPEDVLTDLNRRLASTRFPDSIEDDLNWKAGTNLNYLKTFIAYWRDGYNWRKEEEKLNNIPQFTTTIGNQTLHFIHARSKYAQAQPLLIVHGWPGSFFEFYKILPMLVDPVAYGGREEDAFHVVAPSIPGYGFSSGL
jgi:pimeloyl-ACP methyl ester carboxylesterase